MNPTQLGYSALATGQYFIPLLLAPCAMLSLPWGYLVDARCGLPYLWSAN